MKQLRVGIIGTGMRSASYLHNLSPELRPHVRVVALADPDEGNCAKFCFHHFFLRPQSACAIRLWLLLFILKLSSCTPSWQTSGLCPRVLLPRADWRASCPC